MTAVLDEQQSPPIGDAELETAWLRARLASDVERGATLYWWSRYRAQDALDELWMRALALDLDLIKGGKQGFTIKVTAVAADALFEAIDRHGEAHSRAYRAMVNAARGQLMHDSDRGRATRAAEAAASQRVPLPPDYLVPQAVEKAATEIRMSEAWWTKQTRR